MRALPDLLLLRMAVLRAAFLVARERGRAGHSIGKSFDAPDDVRTLDKVRLEVIDLGSEGNANDGSTRVALVRVHQARRRRR